MDYQLKTFGNTRILIAPIFDLGNYPMILWCYEIWKIEGLRMTKIREGTDRRLESMPKQERPQFVYQNHV